METEPLASQYEAISRHSTDSFPPYRQMIHSWRLTPRRASVGAVQICPQCSSHNSSGAHQGAVGLDLRLKADGPIAGREVCVWGGGGGAQRSAFAGVVSHPRGSQPRIYQLSSMIIPINSGFHLYRKQACGVVLSPLTLESCTSITSGSTKSAKDTYILYNTYKKKLNFHCSLGTQVANLGGHPVQPPFKIPESIIY